MAVYACSDLHGNLTLYKTIKKFIKPEDTVYFLGDANDRGPDSWALVKEISADPQFIYMMGNHEYMLVNAMHDLLYEDYIGDNYQLLASNGGKTTFYDWSNENNKEGWYHCLKDLPYIQNYTNSEGKEIIMTHAGFTPYINKHAPVKYDCVWNREHILDLWLKPENKIVVHGHTPTIYVANDLKLSNIENGALWYCKNHKVCIDCGTHFTGKTCILNLDTYDEYIFSIKGE